MGNERMAAVVRRRRVVQTRSGRTVELSALTLQDLVQLREAAFAEFKRLRIKTWSENAGEMPEDVRSEWIKDAFLRAERLEWSDLPRQTVQTPAGPQGVEYAVWWMSTTMPGQMHTIWLSMRASPTHLGLGLHEAADLLGQDPDEIAEIAEAVAEITAPTLGETQAPREDRRGANRPDRRRGRRRTGQ